jgi:flagellar M-ring protein FliF
VLDQTGALISSAPDSNPQAGLDAQQLQYVAQIEQGYAKRIAELLEPVVGRENLRANVTADVDFSQIESTEEAFKPNQGPDAGPATVRSQQTTEQNGSNTPGASGVPGAASNQPPVAAAAPLSAASGSAASAATTLGANSRRDAVTNFEVDKTVRVTRSATGSIKRLNAAVVVNNRSVTDPKGKTTQVPLAPEELEKLTALVQESIGFNKERGDSVKVVNAPFKVGPVPEEVSVPLWKQPEVIDMLRALAVPAGLSLVAMMIFFGMIRPALNAALAPPVPEPGSNIDASVGGDEALPGLPPASGAIRALEGPMSSGDLDAARNLAMQNPAAVAQIVRGWVNGQPA